MAATRSASPTDPPEDRRWQQMWDLFHDACEVEDREGWLRAHCDDPGLVKQVMELLDAADQADDDLLATDGFALVERPPEHRPFEPGDRLGPYQLRCVLGEGGMGRVFLADQDEPIQRTVALKVIKRGFDSDEVVARFEAERQILARLSHPNVAQVLDAGLTPDGRPFFAMEAVDGEPINEFCDARRLGLEKRLQLMIGIALVHERLGRYEEAESLYRKILALRSAKLGPEHLDLARLRANLSIVLVRQRRFEEAAAISESAVATLKDALGPDHPKALQGASNHGLFTFYAGQREQGLEILRDVQERMERFMDMSNMELRSNLAVQAALLMAEERWSAAKPLLERLMEYHADAGDSGESEAVKMRIAARWGQVLSKLGRLAEGEAWLSRALEFRLDRFGADHRKTRETWSRLEEHLLRTHQDDRVTEWRRRLGLEPSPGSG